MLNEFTWPVQREGHRLVVTGQGGIGKTGLIVQAIGVPPNDSRPSAEARTRPTKPSHSPRKRARWYAPLRKPALFRTFAELGTDQDRILDFANRFGLLTEPEKESLPDWEGAISEMRAAVESWEQASYLSGSMKAGTRIEPHCDVDIALPGASDRASSLASRDAADVLLSTINKNISNVRVFIGHEWGDPRPDSLKLLLMPSNLLEAMWVQFGEAVESNKSFRKCRQCSDWFEISVKVARTDKIFCTEACKAKAYRRRLAEQVQA